VYSGDAGGQCISQRGLRHFAYTIEVDPAPDALVRVAMVFNLANRAPQSLAFHWNTESRAIIAVTISLVSEVQADMIRRKVEQLTCTFSVDLQERVE